MSGARGNGASMFSGRDADMERKPIKTDVFDQSHRLLDRQTRELTDHQHRAKRLRTRETSDGGSQERGT